MTVSIKEIFKKLDCLKQLLCLRNYEESRDLFLEELDVRSMQKKLEAVNQKLGHLKQLRPFKFGRTLRSMERTPTDLDTLSLRRNREPAHLRKMQSMNTKKWSPTSYMLYQNLQCPTEESQDTYFDRKDTDYTQFSRRHALLSDYRRATETGVGSFRSERSRVDYPVDGPLGFLHCKSNSKIMIEDQNLRGAQFPELVYAAQRPATYTSRSPKNRASGFRTIRTHRTNDCMPQPTKSTTPEARRENLLTSPSAMQPEHLRASPLLPKGMIALMKSERKQPSFVVAGTEPIHLQRRAGFYSPKQTATSSNQPLDPKKTLSNLQKQTRLSKCMGKLRQQHDEKKKAPAFKSPLANKTAQYTSNSQVRFEPKTEIIQTPPTVAELRSKKKTKSNHSMDSNLLHLIQKSRSSHLGASPINFTPSIEDARESVDIHLKEMSISDNNRSSHQTIKHGRKD